MPRKGQIDTSSPVKLTDSEKLQLISLVRDNPSLWDQKNPNYHKTKILHQIWESIAKIIHIKDSNPEFIKDQWHALRTYFMGLRRRGQELHNGDGWDESYIPKWQFYKEMMFLTDTLVPRPSISNLDQSVTLQSDPIELESTKQITAEEIDGTDNMSTSTTPPILTNTTNTVYHTNNQVRKRTKFGNNDNSDDATKIFMDSVSTTLKEKSTQTHDDFYCRQLASHLRKIPDSLNKENLKLDLMKQLISFKYSTKE